MVGNNFNYFPENQLTGSARIRLLERSEGGERGEQLLHLLHTSYCTPLEGNVPCVIRPIRTINTPFHSLGVIFADTDHCAYSLICQWRGNDFPQVVQVRNPTVLCEL